MGDLFGLPQVKGAVLSECGLYRYSLVRNWHPGLPPLTFVMLNPSTADADVDDPTIRRCVGFAKREGYGGLQVVNVFAYRATDPRELERAADPQGPENWRYISAAAQSANMIGAPMVCAWGVHAGKAGSALAGKLVGLGASLVALGVTKDGSPKHPLYIAGNAPLMPYAGAGRR